MSRWQKTMLWLGFLGIAVFAAYLWLAREQPAVAERLVAQLPAAMVGKNMLPATGTPLAGPTKAQPSDVKQAELADPALPSLGASDAEAARAFAALPGGDAALGLLARRDLLRRFVTTVDQLAGSKLPVKTRLWPPLSGAFVVDEVDGKLRVGTGNAGRYQPLLAAFLAVEPTAAVQLYRRWYPLLQAAYAETSGTQRLFQTRVLEVIDHLLASRLPDTPPVLLQVEGHYEFAEPALERESIGRKLLLRLGAEHGEKVQQRLSQYRALLAWPAG